MNIRCQVNFIDDQQVRPGYSRSAFTWNLVSFCYINYENGNIGKIRAEGSRQVITATFDHNQFNIRKPSHDFLNGFQVHAGIFADRGMRTTTCFYPDDTLPWKQA